MKRSISRSMSRTSWLTMIVSSVPNSGLVQIELFSSRAAKLRSGGFPEVMKGAGHRAPRP